MSLSFYMKKTYADNAPEIELVNIHYTWTPLGEMPDWEAHRETRAMPRGGVLVRGMGGTTLDDSGRSMRTASEHVELPDDGTRRKIIRLPNAIPDPAPGRYTEHYAFHHYFEIFRAGKREQSPLYTEEIVSKEVEYVDYQGTLGGMCIFWGIYDWDAPQYQPTEESRFIEKYGEDSPYRSYKFYGTEDKETFSVSVPRCYRRYRLHAGLSGRSVARKGRRCIRAGTWGACGIPTERSGGRATGAMCVRRSEVRSVVGCARRTSNHQGRKDWPKLQ